MQVFRPGMKENAGMFSFIFVLTRAGGYVRIKMKKKKGELPMKKTGKRAGGRSFFPSKEAEGLLLAVFSPIFCSLCAVIFWVQSAGALTKGEAAYFAGALAFPLAALIVSLFGALILTVANRRGEIHRK